MLSSSVTQMMLSSDWCTDVRDIILFLTSWQSTEVWARPQRLCSEVELWSRNLTRKRFLRRESSWALENGSVKGSEVENGPEVMIYQTSSRSVRAAFRSHHRRSINMLERLQMFVWIEQTRLNLHWADRVCRCDWMQLRHSRWFKHHLFLDQPTFSLYNNNNNKKNSFFSNES